MTISQQPSTRSRSYSIGFTSLNREQQPTQLPLQGQLPDWLTGSLLRTGPAKFEVATESYRHWFDGLAMLYRFSFQNNQVVYGNRFLKSNAYLEAVATGKITRIEFGTNPRYSFFEWLGSFFEDHTTDNANVSISQFNHQYVALTEVPHPVIFDPETLQTIGKFQYSDDAKGQISIAHPHFDFQRRELISYVTQLSLKSTYHVYQMPENSNQRQIIASIPVQEAAYMHTFALTENFVILVEFPRFFNLLKTATRLTTVEESFDWKPERGTRFLIINRHDGSVTTAHGQAFFAFHHVNAFEQGNEILLDTPAYPDDALIDGFYLSELRNATDRVITGGELRRYRIPLNGGSVSYEVIADAPIELSRINYRRCSGQPYQFAYGTSNQQPHNFSDSLVKINVQQGTTQIWQESGCYPGEPIFAASPNATGEDEGVILSVVVDTRKSSSFLLVLDAQSFTEMARAETPHLIPFHFHGQYFEHPLR